MAKYALALLIVTGVGTFIGILGLFWIRKTFVETKRTAKAAIKANKIARDSSQRQLRAYISVDNIMLKDVGVGKHPTGHVLLKNSGQTPAYHVHAQQSIAFGISTVPKGKFPAHPKPADDRSTDVIGAQGAASVSVRKIHALRAEEVELIRGGSHAIYVAGEVEYLDVFGVSRTTRFRFRYNSRCLGTDQMEICDEGNEAD